MNDARYQPVNCEFHDVLESVATRRSLAWIVYTDEWGARQKLRDRITDIYARDGGEYLSLKSGPRIRLDRIVSVDGFEVSDFGS